MIVLPVKEQNKEKLNATLLEEYFASVADVIT